MIPLKCETRRGGFAFATVAVILVCVGVYVGQSELLAAGTTFTPVGLMQTLVNPSRAFGVVAVALVVAMFTHASLMHLISNMWFLWLFGSALERTAGTLLFFLTYLLCGVVSMIIQAFATPYSDIPIVGASGAIAGVMGALLVLQPLCKTVIWVPIFFFFRVPAFLFLLLWLGMQWLGVRGDTHSGHGGVAWWAHIGGFAAGFLIALEMRRRAWLNRAKTGSSRNKGRGEHA